MVEAMRLFQRDSRVRVWCVVLVLAAILSPWGQWRIKVLVFKFVGNAPEWSWTKVAVGMIPFTAQSNVLNEPFRGSVTFVKRDKESPCPVLWDTPLGPTWAPFRAQKHLDWFARRWPYLQERFSDGPSVPKGGVVLEVGAWVGNFVREALNRGAGKVIAIEPEPGNFACLQKNFVEEVAQGRVTLVEAAAWHSDGTARFGHSARDEFGNPQFGGEGFTARDDGDTIVRTVRIDRLVRELGLQSVDLIEMDVEGTERYALAGATQTLARFGPEIIVCVHHLPDDPEAVHEAISNANPAYRRSVEERHAFYRVSSAGRRGEKNSATRQQPVNETGPSLSSARPTNSERSVAWDSTGTKQ